MTVRFQLLTLIFLVSVFFCMSSIKAAEIGEHITVNQFGSDFEGTSVAVTPNGAFVVAWQETRNYLNVVEDGLDGNGSGVFARVFDKNGVAVTGEFLVNQKTEGNQWAPDVASDEFGNFVITWTDYVGYIYARRYDSTGVALGDEFLVNTTVPHNNVRSAISMTASGAFCIIWMGTDTTYGAYGTYGKCYSADGVAIADAFLINTTIEMDQSYPSVSMNDNGDFVVVWHDGFFSLETLNGADGSGWGIRGQMFDNSGNTIGEEIQINSHTLGNQRYPQVALDSTGTFTVIWSDDNQYAPTSVLIGKVFNSAGNAISDEFLVSTDVFGTSLFTASIDTFSEGGTVIVYAKGDNKVYGRRYSKSGIPIEEEFEVSSPTVGGLASSVATDGDRNFVVSWRGSILAPINVYAQIFDDTPVVKKEDNVITTNTDTSSGSVWVLDPFIFLLCVAFRFARNRMNLVCTSISNKAFTKTI